MAQSIRFPTHTDARGSLTVMDRDLPFLPKRVFTLYDFKAPRGGHGHLYSHTILVAMTGKLQVEVRTKGDAPGPSKVFVLESPDTGLYLKPEDWHQIVALSPDTAVMCICSEHFSKDDYFYDKP